jgi:hypothetical protein
METNLKSPVKILIKALEKFQVKEDEKSGALRIVMNLKDYKLLKNKVKQLEEDILEFSYFNGMHDGMNHFKNINKNK